MKPIYKPSKTMEPSAHFNLAIDDDEGREPKDGPLLPPPAVYKSLLGKGRRLGSRAHCVAVVAIAISLLCLSSCVLIGSLVYFRLTGLTEVTEKLAAPAEVCLPCEQVSPHPLDPDVTAQELLQTLERRYGAGDEERVSPECCASTPGQYAALFKLVLKRQEEVKRLSELLDPQVAIDGGNLPQDGFFGPGGPNDDVTDPNDDNDSVEEDVTEAPVEEFPAGKVNSTEDDDAVSDNDDAAVEDDADDDDDVTAPGDDAAAEDDADDDDDVTAPDDDTAADDDADDDDDDATAPGDDTAADAEVDNSDENNDDDATVPGEEIPAVDDDDDDDVDDDDDSPAEDGSSRKYSSGNKLSTVSAHLILKPPTDSSAVRESLVQWKSPADSVLSYLQPGLSLDMRTQTTINVTSAGYYFIYCQMLYTGTPMTTTEATEDSIIVSSYVHRRSLLYPAASGILLKTRHTRHDVSSDRHSSYVAGLFYLHSGDQLYVRVSDPGAVAYDDRGSFLGLFRVGG